MMTLFYLHRQTKSTVAYGKTLAGTNYNYASVAWSVVNSEEEGKDEYDFTPSGTIDGQDYVDLGIGIGWATSNVGAALLKNLVATTCGLKLQNIAITIGGTIAFIQEVHLGILIQMLSVHLTDNIAGTAYDVHVKDGKPFWRMPTRAELTSLANNCQFYSWHI